MGRGNLNDTGAGDAVDGENSVVLPVEIRAIKGCWAEAQCLATVVKRVHEGGEVEVLAFLGDVCADGQFDRAG